jgi:hypothetical protein
MSPEAIRNWSDAGDRQLARSIFGTDEWEIVAGMILDWMIARGFGPGHIRSIELSVAAAETQTSDSIEEMGREMGADRRLDPSDARR